MAKEKEYGVELACNVATVTRVVAIEGLKPGEDGDDDGGKKVINLESPAAPENPLDRLPSLDSHEDFTDAESEIIDQIIRDKVDEIEKTSSWGNLPGDVIETIKSAQRPKVNWVGLLKFYYGEIVCALLESTITRPNRRYGPPYLGSKKTYQDKVLVAFDASGSVPSDAISQFVAETNQLAEQVPVDFIVFDTAVCGDKAQPWDGKHDFLTLKARGGTDFHAPLEFAIKHKYHTIVYLTDGECSIPVPTSKIDVVWVITPEGADAKAFRDAGYRRVVKMVTAIKKTRR